VPANRLDPAVRRYWSVQFAGGAALLGLAGLIAARLQIGTAAFGGALVLAGLLAAAVVPAIRYRLYRWEVNEVGVYMQRGLVIHRTTLLAHGRVTGAGLRAGPVQRACGLATITIGAGRHLRLRIAGLSGFEADRLAREIRERAASVRPKRRRSRPSDTPMALRGVSQKAALALASLYAGPPLLAAVPLALAGRDDLFVGAVGLAVIGASAAVESRRHLGYAVRGSRITVRSGIVRRRETVIDATDVVALSVREGPVQRALDLSTVAVLLDDGTTHRVRQVDTVAVAPICEALLPELRASAEAARERSVRAAPPTRTPARRRSSAGARAAPGPRTPEGP
jgi:membrane protein YdbS with pleckstrin-like domain